MLSGRETALDGQANQLVAIKHANSQVMILVLQKKKNSL